MLTLALGVVTVLLAYVCLMLLLRCLGAPALSLGGWRLETERAPALEGERFTRAMGLKSAAWAALLLAALYGASAVWCAVTKNELSWEGFFSVWRHWDAPHYLDLAEKGFAGCVSEEGEHLFLVFFPLYPWLIRLLHAAIPHWQLCGHIVSAACFIAGCWVFARLVTEQFGWRTARLSLLLLSACPYSFFFGAAYTESLFFLVSVSSFYFIRRHRYMLAGLLGALAALTRVQGLLLILAGAAEYAVAERPFSQLRRRDWRGFWRGAARSLLPLALIAAGTGIYLCLNWSVEGDPFRFLTYQREHWDNAFSPLPACLRTIWGRVFAAQTKVVFATWLPELAVFAVCLPLVVYAVRRMPAPWTMYALANLLVSYSISWPLSSGRYMACAFPLYVSAAVLLRRRPGVGQFAALLGMAAQGALFFTFLSAGHVY